MLKNLIESKTSIIVEHELCFYTDDNGGFGFPCDADGNVFPLEYECARENLAYCLTHPEEFQTYAKVETYKHRVKEPAHGRCSCGREVYLTDEYYGSCQCECGKWYNLFGQELLPPEQWVIDPSEEEYW